MPVMTFTEFTT